MNLSVDGLIFQDQKYGGISRVFSEILPRMCDLNEDLSIDLFTVGKPKRFLPSHQRIFHRQIPQAYDILRPNRLFKYVIPTVNKMLKRLMVGDGEGRIWHSTYFTLPAKWQGKQVVTVHDMIFEQFPELYDDPYSRNLRKRKTECIKNADAVICVSDTTKKTVKSYLNLSSQKIYVVHLAASGIFKRLSMTKNAISLGINKPFILYSGQRWPHKNFDTLAKAYSFWNNKQDFSLIVVGKPWSDEEKKRLEDLNIYGHVTLKTGVDDQYLCCLYNLASAFVYPSLYEGFGIPLLEAMSCGCPIIASRIPSTIEIGGDIPYYFDPQNVDELLHAIDTAINKGRENQRINNGYIQARLYSWNKTAEKTLNIYREIEL